jgi:hypothetical protein
MRENFTYGSVGGLVEQSLTLPGLNDGSGNFSDSGQNLGNVDTQTEKLAC